MAISGIVRAVGRRRHRDEPEHWLAAARASMRAVSYCTLVTTGPSGPTARTVQPYPADDSMTVVLGTDRASRKAAEIAATGSALLVYQRDRDRACVVAYCHARVVTDPEFTRNHFMGFWRAFWPDGPTSTFVNVVCEPYALEIWDIRRGVTPPPFGLRSARLDRGDNGEWRPLA